MRHHIKWLIFISLAIANNCFALVDVLPAYRVSPTLNGLNIAYFTQQDRVKITLYLVNHETFPVICDAEYQGGPDTKNTREQTVLPEKAIAFVFSYPKKTDSVSIQLICIKPADTEQTDSALAPAVPSTVPGTTGTTSIIETDLSISH